MRALLAVCTFVIALFAPPSLAQSYPAGPVQIVTPYGAGGTVDLVARQISKKLEEKLKGSFVVTYKLGASGTIAAASVASAKPDGYTLLLGYTNELAISPWLMRTTYTVKDFEPIAFLGSTPFVLIGRKDLAANSIKELVALARSRPDGLTYGSAGLGSLPHIAGALLAHQTGTNLRHVPYKGGPQAIADLLGGHVDLYFSGVPGALSLIRNGSVKVFAVADDKRSISLPEVPTMQEAGVSNFSIPGWFALLAPKDTPATVINQLRDACAFALADPGVQDFYKTNAIAAQHMQPDALKVFIDDESEKYHAFLEKMGIKAGN